MRMIVAVVACALGAPALAAPRSVVVMPVQGGLPPDIAAEVSEQARAQATAVAPALGLVVMSKKDFEKLCSEKKLTTPCSDSDCDLERARAVKSDLVLSTKVLKSDGAYVLTIKLFDVGTGQQLSVRNADSPSTADLLSQAPKLAEAVIRAALASTPAAATMPPTSPPPTSPPAPAVDTRTVLLDGPVAFGQDGDLFGRNGQLMLYPDRLVFQMTGANFNNKRTEIALSDINSVNVVNDEVQVATKFGRKYRVTARNNSEWATAIEKCLKDLKR